MAARKHLTKEDRVMIEGYLKDKMSFMKISALLGTSKGTISREIQRNSKASGEYSASHAQTLAEKRRKNKESPIANNETIQKSVLSYIKNSFSPEQIIGYTTRIDGSSFASINTIYKIIHLLIDKKKIKITEALRRGGKRYIRRKKKDLIKVKNKVSIDERPEIINSKQEFGHWEGDTIVGSGHQGYAVTLVERTTKFLIMIPISFKTAWETTQVIERAIKQYQGAFKSLTLDNGTEFAYHKDITDKFNIPIYFAHPYSSWERGLNENTNGLIRQFIPKNANINVISEYMFDKYSKLINNRPRKLLDYHTPMELFHKNLSCISC